MERQQLGTKTKWVIDPAHTEIGFRVKHLMFANVRGRFKSFDSNIISEGNSFTSAEIKVVIDASSISTGIDQRDDHLRSADFFDAEQFPQIIFIANTFVATDNERHYEMYGDLIMKGNKNEIKLDVEMGPIVKDPWGSEKALFSIQGKINRKDWGLNYNALLETGGVVVSEDVWITCDVQLIKQV